VSEVARAVRWAGGGALATLLAWAAGTSLCGLAWVLGVTVIATGVLCWADDGRSWRLASIIDAWRGHGLPQPAGQPTGKTARRRRAAADSRPELPGRGTAG